MKQRVVTVGSYVVPVVLVAGGVFVGTRVVMREIQPREASAAVRNQRDQSKGPTPTDDVAIVGDSIVDSSEVAMREAFGSRYKMSLRARGGYRLEEMEPYAIELSTTEPEQVIIELGTNDVLVNWPQAKSVQAFERMISRFDGAKCVHVVTVNENISTDKGADIQQRAATLNVELRKVAAAHGANVIDWAATLQADIAAGSKKGGLTSDGVHPNSLGRHTLADLFIAALDGCK